MRVRKATIKDLKAIQELNAKLFRHDFRFDKTLDNKWPYTKDGISYYKKSISHNNQVCLVCENEKGKIIGYLIGGIMKDYSYRLKTKVAELENTYIEVGCRRQGVGSLLFKNFKKWAKGKKAKYLKVYAYSKNSNALSFYRKHGFRDEENILTQKI